MTSQLGTVDKEPIFSINPIINEVATTKSVPSQCSLFTSSFSLENVVLRAISGYSKDECYLCICENDNNLKFIKFLEKNKNFEFELYESYFNKLNVLITDTEFKVISEKDIIYISIFYTYNR